MDFSIEIKWLTHHKLPCSDHQISLEFCELRFNAMHFSPMAFPKMKIMGSIYLLVRNLFGNDYLKLKLTLGGISSF